MINMTEDRFKEITNLDYNVFISEHTSLPEDTPIEELNPDTLKDLISDLMGWSDKAPY
jgi:hypothetical protein